jgi:hypothetical protein
MGSFVTGVAIAALLATGMYFALNYGSVGMVEAYSDRSVIVHDLRNDDYDILPEQKEE